MLGGAWLLFTFVLLLTAILLRQAPILLMALLFFLVSGITRLWARYALERVEYSRHLATPRVFFGETVTLEIEVSNRKLLPLPWVHIQDEVPDGVVFPKGTTHPSSSKPTRAILPNFLSLGWYHRLIHRYQVQCLRRGYFTFGPATIRSGDLFGFFQKESTVRTLDRLLVYPRIVSLEELGLPSRDPFGDLRIRRHLFEDPVQVLSTRDYAYGDPLKRIHWKATARLSRLQSRVFEPTTTVDLALFLDMRTAVLPHLGPSEQLLETAVITAASIASHALRHGYRIGLYVNEPYRGTDHMIKLPPSNHPEQEMRVLEALAQVQGWPFMPVEELLNTEGRGLPWSATLAVITAAPLAPVLACLHRFRRVGRRVALIAVGGNGPRLSMDGITMYRVSDQLYRQERDALRLLGSDSGEEH
ncbi:MAG: DUF58 domain-containing protein [Chloroflexota bacterium]